MMIHVRHLLPGGTKERHTYRYEHMSYDDLFERSRELLRKGNHDIRWKPLGKNRDDLDWRPA